MAKSQLSFHIKKDQHHSCACGRPLATRAWNPIFPNTAKGRKKRRGRWAGEERRGKGGKRGEAKEGRDAQSWICRTSCLKHC